MEKKKKIVDFGLSQDLRNGEITLSLGSCCYLSPEIVKKQPHSFSTDIWSFGICVMELCEGQTPHYDCSIRNMFLLGMDDPPKLQNKEDFTSDLNDFLDKCIQISPENRSTAEGLLKV